VRLRGDRYGCVADNPAKNFVDPHQLKWRMVRVRRLGSLHANARSGGDIDAEIASLDNLDTALRSRRDSLGISVPGGTVPRRTSC
jgi:hypothetical protein